jgi:hypothetical protein
MFKYYKEMFKKMLVNSFTTTYSVPGRSSYPLTLKLETTEFTQGFKDLIESDSDIKK